jgi:GTP pyrophosphokinase
LSPTDRARRLAEAFAYACELHATQRRKGSEIPYVSHLMSTAAMVMAHGGSADEVVAALLHDAVEDQGGLGTLETIRERFGDPVAGLVLALSDSTDLHKGPWRARKEAYLKHLEGAAPSVRLICCADKLDNARALLADYRAQGEAVWERFNGGRDGTLWYYRSVVDTLRASGENRPIVHELERVVGALEAAARRIDMGGGVS